jgi:hypothetical protein
MDRWMVRFLLEHSVELEERSFSQQRCIANETPALPRETITTERTQMAENVVAYLWNGA